MLNCRTTLVMGAAAVGIGVGGASAYATESMSYVLLLLAAGTVAGFQQTIP